MNFLMNFFDDFLTIFLTKFLTNMKLHNSRNGTFLGLVYDVTSVFEKKEGECDVDTGKRCLEFFPLLCMDEALLPCMSALGHSARLYMCVCVRVTCAAR